MKFGINFSIYGLRTPCPDMQGRQNKHWHKPVNNCPPSWRTRRKQKTIHHEELARKTRCYKDLASGQIHWNMNCPIQSKLIKQFSAGILVVTAFRSFWGHLHPLPAKWNNSDCQILPLLSSERENVGFTAKRTDRFCLAAFIPPPQKKSQFGQLAGKCFNALLAFTSH
jgi:hypothetical protein